MGDFVGIVTIRKWLKYTIDKSLAFSSFHSDSYQYRLKKHLIGLVRNPLDLKEVPL